MRTQSGLKNIDLILKFGQDKRFLLGFSIAGFRVKLIDTG